MINSAVRQKYGCFRGKKIALFVKIATLPFLLFSIYMRIIKTKPKAIHLNSVASVGLIRDLLIMSYGKMRNIKCIIHFHTGRLPRIFMANGLEKFFVHLVAKFVDTIIVLDLASAMTLKTHLPKTEILFIPNPIDIKLFVTGNLTMTRTNTVLYCGNIIPDKGINELISAWKSISTKNWRLKIIGPIAETFAYNLKKELSEDNSIEFQDSVSREIIFQEIYHSQIIVLPSYSEGFPMIILEAMAIGRAIIATDVGSIGWMLQDECGIVIPPRNDVALADALTSLMTDQMGRTLLEENAKKRSQSFEIEKISKMYEQVWFGT
jgi:glycosyltransferase involved in cell wall biosynthesis